MIVLRFSTTRNWESALIRWRTDSAISHVEFYDTDTRATLGARFSLRSVDNGVHLRPPSANVAQRGVILASFIGIEKAYDWARKNSLGRRYDWRGILGIAAGNPDEHDREDRFCSETVLEAAIFGARNKLLNCKPWLATPRDLLISPLVSF